MSFHSVLKRCHGRPVSALWDYPNSPAAKGMIAPMVAKIRKSLRPINPVVEFTAYTTPLGPAIHHRRCTELREAGIQVNEYDKRGADGKDPVDEAIIQKLEALGASSSKVFVVLISADGGYVDTIKKLRAAGHSVCLVLSPKIRYSEDLLLSTDFILFGEDFTLLPIRV
ncbi:hypothetical protein FS837_011728 [Tulasnella sp. UAMH 9824]|nr:hypothetical protein FS837_011728 [Tulasnella sp. UAMH 9824]